MHSGSNAKSLLLVEEIANWTITHGLLFLLTSRAPAVAGEHVTSLSLRPLRAEASENVARMLSTTDSGSRSDELIKWCIASSGGNPYFLIELLRGARKDPQGYRAHDTLARLLQSRVLLLSIAARNLLEVCCVLGKHSTLERIASCLDVSRPTILNALAELGTSGMLAVDGAHLISRHDLLTTVVLSQMNDAVKLVLHHFVASELEREAHIGHSMSLIWESAEHWLLASEISRAVELLRRCGRHLMDVGMPEEAVAVLQRAEELCDEPLTKYQIGAERARALMRAEHSREAVAVIDNLLKMRSTIHPPPSPLDEVVVMSFHARWANGDSIPELVRDCMGALSSNDASPEERVQAASWLLTAADNLCDRALGQRIYEQVAPHLGSNNIEPSARLYFLMVYHCSSGDGSTACELARELGDYAKHKSPPTIAVRHLRHVAHVLSCHGTSGDALAIAEESYLIASRGSAVGSMASSACIVASIHMHNGDYPAAETWLQRALQARKPGVLTVANVNTWSFLAELAIERGQLEDAEKYLSMCLPSVPKSNAPRSLARGLSLQVQLEVAKGQTIPDAYLDALREVFNSVKHAVRQDFTADSLIRGLISTNRTEEARAVAAEYVQYSRRDVGAISASLASTLRRLTPVAKTTEL